MQAYGRPTIKVAKRAKSCFLLALDPHYALFTWSDCCL